MTDLTTERQLEAANQRIDVANTRIDNHKNAIIDLSQKLLTERTAKEAAERKLAAARETHFNEFLDLACRLNPWIDRALMQNGMRQALAQIEQPESKRQKFGAVEGLLLLGQIEELETKLSAALNGLRAIDDMPAKAGRLDADAVKAVTTRALAQIEQPQEPDADLATGTADDLIPDSVVGAISKQIDQPQSPSVLEEFNEKELIQILADNLHQSNLRIVGRRIIAAGWRKREQSDCEKRLALALSWIDRTMARIVRLGLKERIFESECEQ